MRLVHLLAMIPIGSHPAWHPVLETLAYGCGYALYRRLRARSGDFLPDAARWNVIAAAAVGALIGSRVLGLAEQFPTLLAAWRGGQLLTLVMTPGGKTIVGGILGGWLAVELVKRLSGIKRRTGDLFVLPLCLAIAIGRVGCLVAGLADDTYGVPTTLPWAVDLGDHVGRHPVQVYEILFLGGMAWVLKTSERWTLPEGARFRLFLAGYLGWRLGIDFWKPQPLVAGMNVIQWSCVAGIGWLAVGAGRQMISGWRGEESAG